MLLSQSYEVEAKIKNLSGRLEQFGREINLAYTHANEKIRSENLKFNLSMIISRIILNLVFENRSAGSLQSIIKQYNRDNATKLKLHDFEETNWIRYINQEIEFPSIIRYSLWEISYNEKEGNTPNIPDEMKHKLRCLQLFYKKHFEDVVPKISTKKIASLIRKYKTAATDIDLKFFVDIGLVKKNGDYCTWQGGDYTRYLSDEICATIWLILTDKGNAKLAIRRYLKILNACQIWPKAISKFLNSSVTNTLCDEIVSLLREEEDLLASDNELQKVLLDPPSYRDRELNKDVPPYKFDYSTTQNFLESVNYFEWHYREAFDHQTVRGIFNVLINILVSSEAKAHKPFERTLELFADPTRPYVVLELYNLIKRRYPEVIPYMLVRSDLAVIAFELIDKIEINSTLLQYHEYHNGSHEEGIALKSRFWLEMFDLALELVSLNSTLEAGKYLSKILLDIADKVFINNSNLPTGQATHTEFKKRYDETLRLLNTRRLLNRHSIASNHLQPRVILLSLPEISDALIELRNKKRLPHNAYIHLQSGWYDLSLELVRLSKMRVHKEEISLAQQKKIAEKAENLIDVLFLETEQFYTVKEIKTISFDFTNITVSKVNRNVNSFAFEIIDWGFLYANFHKASKLTVLHSAIINSIEFNVTESKYFDLNKEQKEKIQLYLLSLLLAFLDISKRKDMYEIEGYNVGNLIEKLQDWINNLAVMYSVEDIPNRRIDVFAERHSFSFNIYSQRLTTLLFRCVNLFDADSQEHFIEDFFKGSVDIGKMLEASNIIERKKLVGVISEKIDAIPIDQFINSSIFTFELQSALIDAANSEKHWALAKPLLEKLQTHFDRVKHPQDHIRDLLFEVDLLLAFKDKDITRLQNIEVPGRDGFDRSEKVKPQQLKQFFTALHYLHNENNYDSAISILQTLHANSPKSVRFAFKLFEGQTHKAIKTENVNELRKAHQEWQDFVNSLSVAEKVSLSEYQEAIAANELHLFSATGDLANFDHSITKLSERYLFDESVLPTIFDFYARHDLADLGYYYLMRSRDYYVRNDVEIPFVIKKMLDDAIDNHALAKFKSNLSSIRSLPYDVIPKIIPEALNGKREINEFILFEIINATRVVLDKIHSVKQITHENRYNDLLLATLRLRFPFYGWSIVDQSRIGKSHTDKDAGEIDLLIQAAGINIAFIEALILKSNQVAYTQKHIRKCFDYVSYLDRYYVVSYYKGDPLKLEAAWINYQANVLATALPAFAEIDNVTGFKDLTGGYPDTKHLKIGTTVHKNNTLMYHLMVKTS